jgi:hypothetical protein
MNAVLRTGILRLIDGYCRHDWTTITGRIVACEYKRSLGLAQKLPRFLQIITILGITLFLDVPRKSLMLTVCFDRHLFHVGFAITISIARKEEADRVLLIRLRRKRRAFYTSWTRSAA